MSTGVSPNRRLSDLGASALLGTDRAGGGKDAARKLLNEAAIIGARARAGTRHAPPGGATAVAPCPDDPRPIAGAAAMATLERLLADPDAALVEEWADLARAMGVRVADGTVPAVLEWWARQPRRSETVFAALGKRAEWLAELNPAWKRPVAVADVPADAEQRWQTGTAAERAALMLSVRRGDAARGRALVESTWKADGADERRRFVEAMGEGLSMDDEPFLEGALDDKGKTVREAVAGLLTRLPASRFAARMKERALAIVRVEQGKKGVLRRAKTSLVVEQPKAFDPAWARDGIEEKQPSGIGQKAWWMRQIISRTPPELLGEGTGMWPAEFIAGVAETDFADDVLAGLNESVPASGSAVWCVALVRQHMTRKPELNTLMGLWRRLEAAEVEPLLLEVIASDHLPWSGRWVVLGTTTHKWSPGFSVKALRILGAKGPTKAAQWWEMHDAAAAISRYVHPSAVTEFEEAVEGAIKNNPTPGIVKSVDRVRLRAEMRKEFKP